MQIADCENNAGHKYDDGNYKANGSSNTGLATTYDIPRGSCAAPDDYHTR